MNFLAHVHLSHRIPSVIVGNLCADGFKGSKYKSLPEDIQKGVVLHRKIDELTDSHPETIRLKRLLSSELGRYSGVALDVFYDHFLSLHWDSFSHNTLEKEVNHTHQVIQEYYDVLNNESIEFLDKMIRYEWLTAYKDKETLHKIFVQMSYRFKVPILVEAVKSLDNQYSEIEKGFKLIYPELFSTCRVELALD